MELETLIKPNTKQQECIDCLEGKYLVLAGPGTGKTFTVIQRIKNMILTGVSPEKILCLTFTDAAANEMRKRIEKELNKNETGVNIYTYHGFCCDILESYPEDFELGENFKIITDSVSRAFLKDCIDELNPKAYRTSKNDPYFFIDTIKNQIEEIKKYRLTKEQYFYNLEKNPDWKPKLALFQKQLEEKVKKGDTRTTTLEGKIKAQIEKLAKADELWSFYELYQDKMFKNHYLDFNDMIGLVLEKFETSPAVLEKVADNYEYILVDEYQDTNKSQNDLIFLLTRALKSGNVFVVGDDDQIIYTFQGARLDTIECFLREFPDTKVVCLNENMRSTQAILDVAREITKQDSSRLEINPDFSQFGIDKNLTAKNDEIIQKNKPVRCHKYADTLQEYVEIVDEIEVLIKSADCPVDKNGKALSEIAVLTRTNAELETFAEMFKERNIPYELKDGKNIFTIKSSIVLYFYMQLLTNPELHSDKFFKLLLSKPFSINPKDFETLYNWRSKSKSFVEVMRSVKDEDFLEPDKIKRFVETFDYLLKYSTNETLKNVILEIGSKTGIFDYYLNSEINRCENIAGIKKLIDEASALSAVNKTTSIADFVEYLDSALIDDIQIKTDKAPVTLNAVQLCTYYAAKGREFEYVYMPSLDSKKWESDNKSLQVKIPVAPCEYKNEDELKAMKRSDRIKVMYVGMTRAKHALRLSYAAQTGTSVKKPSEFIYNILDMTEKEPEPFTYDETSFWMQVNKSIVKRDYDYSKEFCDMVDSKIADKHFSPSSVNMYLKCPRQYLYNYILDLASKDGSPDRYSYGLAVHKACEFAVKYAKENLKYPSKEEFIEVFKQDIVSRPLSAYEQREILLIRGEKALDAYYPQLCATPVEWLYGVEQSVSFELDGVKFFGIIDRVDKNPDGTYTIYDYKTGSAKNIKSICQGGEHEDYYNQIGLYKYYFEKSTGNKVKETTFIFPEDFTKNLTIDFTDEDIKSIENIFKSAISDIKSYKFEPSYKKEACEYCQFKEFCTLETV